MNGSLKVIIKFVSVLFELQINFRKSMELNELLNYIVNIYYFLLQLYIILITCIAYKIIFSLKSTPGRKKINNEVFAKKN